LTRVLVIDFFMRIRDFKQAYALNTRPRNGIQLSLARTTRRDDNLALLPGMTVYDTDSDLTNIADIITKVKPDVIHTHADGHAYKLLRRGLAGPGKCKLVHECHDPASAYHGKPQDVKDRERIVMNKVDNVVCVSPEMQTYLDKLYGIASKCRIIYSYPNAKLIPKRVPGKPKKRIISGVYQGGMGTYKHHHRYYRDIFAKLTAQGLCMDTYSSHGDIDYKLRGVTNRPFIGNIQKLYSTLSAYDFGFVGFNAVSKPLLHMARPNKLYEYIGAGLPLLAMDYQAMKKFITNQGFGVVLDPDLKLPPDFQDRMVQARKNVRKSRHKFTMESQLSTIEELYIP